MRVAFDIDNILLDTNSAILEVLNTRYNFNLTLQDCTEYEINNIVHLPQKELSDAINYAIQFCPLDIIPYSYELLRYFGEKDGSPLIFITGRPKELEEITYNQIKVLCGRKRFKIIYVGSQKDCLPSKLDVLNQYRIRLFFEDLPLHWPRYLTNNIQIVTLKLPWNERYYTSLKRYFPDTIEAYTGWDEYLIKLGGINE